MQIFCKCKYFAFKFSRLFKTPYANRMYGGSIVCAKSNCFAVVILPILRPGVVIIAVSSTFCINQTFYEQSFSATQTIYNLQLQYVHSPQSVINRSWGNRKPFLLFVIAYLHAGNICSGVSTCRRVRYFIPDT